MEVEDFWRAAALGASAGLRTATAPAVLSRCARRGDLAGIEGTRFSALASPVASNALLLFAIGELVADKLSILPARTNAGSIFGRLVSGGLCGATLHAATGRNAAAGAAVAGAGAMAAALLGEGYRGLGSEAGAPDPLLALLEDATALGLAVLAVRDLRGR